MSDENAPKFRLKPKLTGDTSSSTPPAAKPSASMASQPVSPVGEGAARQPVLRPKPKVSPAPSTAAEVIVPAPVAPAVPSPVSRSVPVTPPPPAPRVAPAKPKIALKPRSDATLTASAPESSPLPEDTTAPFVPPAPRPPSSPPHDISSASGAASTAPNFPPPKPKFPPPPGVRKAGAAPAPKTKRWLLLAVGALVAMAIVGGAFFAYLKFTAPPPPPSKPVAGKPAAIPVPHAAAPAPQTPQGQAVAKTKATIEKIKQEQLGPLNEVVAADQPAAPSAEGASAAVAPAQSGAVAAQSTPTAVRPVVASPAFRAWVQGLKISGVRTGSTPRIFIERTAYAPGDLVNPQLGITFEAYETATRTLVFKDRSGATVERRN